MTVRTGGCLCGAIRYQLSSDPVFNVACHCRACQFTAGGSPTLVMIFPRAAFKITKGEPRTYWSTGDSGEKVGRSFCEVCATPLYSLPPTNPDIVAIKVGSLDDPSAFQVHADIFMAAAQPWHRPHDGAIQMPGNPPVPGA